MPLVASRYSRAPKGVTNRAPDVAFYNSRGVRSWWFNELRTRRTWYVGLFDLHSIDLVCRDLYDLYSIDLVCRGISCLSVALICMIYAICV